MSNFIYQRPLTAKVLNKNLYMNMTTGHIALMCPECFNMAKVGIRNTIAVENSEDIEYFNCSIGYHGVCPNCKEDVKFRVIDINMAQIINILNNKGYYTAYCCEGHINEDEFMYPYIYFYFWEDKDILNTHPLPATWYITEDLIATNTFSICDYTHYADKFEDDEAYDKYLEWVKKDWDQESVLKDIYNWANSLPDKDPIVKKYQRDIINLHGDDIIDINATKAVMIGNIK